MTDPLVQSEIDRLSSAFVDDNTMREYIPQSPVSVLYSVTALTTEKAGYTAEVARINALIAQVDFILARMGAVGCSGGGLIAGERE